MAAGEQRGQGAQFLDRHPELREARARSPRWSEFKQRASLDLDGETVYVVRGDTLGDEDDLYVDALARGSAACFGDLFARELFLELDSQLQVLVRQELRKETD